MRGAAAALALAVTLAGCGGPGELERFRTEQLRPLQAGVEEDRAAVGRIVETLQVGNERDARLLGRAIDRLAGRARQARALDAPEEAAVETLAYAEAIEALAGRLRAYAGAVAAGRGAAARDAAAQAQQAVDLLIRRRQALERAVTDE